MSTSSVSRDPNIFDPNSLSELKRLARTGDPAAIKGAAKQFEALFLQMVLKSMRDATPQDGLFDSEQTRMYQSLLDQQLTQVMASKGTLGLAAVIERQLGGQSAEPDGSARFIPLNSPAANGNLQTAPRSLPLPAVDAWQGLPLPRTSQGEPSADARDFVNRIWPAAQEAGRATGIPPTFLVAQAALETGWGKSEPKSSDGRRSYNLFGIKAGRSWNGDAVEASTTEYQEGGEAQKQVERFRAYGSYEESFRDYAKLLLSNPRYAGVLGSQDGDRFARGLQQAGYATDPAYAEKLRRILAGNTLKLALAG